MHLGLPRDLSTELVVQTMLGSAKLLRESGEHPTVLRERVTSPGGTTAAALPPSSSIAWRIMAKQRRACAAASPGVEEPSGSTGAVPATRIRSPALTAREKP